MLRRLLTDIFERKARGGGAGTPQPASVARQHKLAAAHRGAPLKRHLEILFAEKRLGGAPALELTAESLRRTGSSLAFSKAIARHEAVMNLAAYFLHVRALPGRWVECGVFHGFSALGVCLAARAADPAFKGDGLHLVDSFAGLSAAAEKDHHMVAGDDGATLAVAPAPGAGALRASLVSVRAALAEFPGVSFHEGWIPQVLATLPAGGWSYVHIDVDLYEPTLACLEFFVPKLVPGGVVICDDYGSLVFPGAERAWDEFCTRNGIPFVQLPTGQSVILNP